MKFLSFQAFNELFGNIPRPCVFTQGTRPARRASPHIREAAEATCELRFPFAGDEQLLGTANTTGMFMKREARGHVRASDHADAWKLCTLSLQRCTSHTRFVSRACITI